MVTINASGLSGISQIKRVGNQVWTYVVIPDTQELASHDTDSYGELIDYIIAQKTARNIQFVMHVGDTVDNGTQSAQWAVADTALAGLEGEIPYLIGIGNHDYDDDSGTSRTATEFNSAFPAATYEANDWFLDADTGTANTAARISVGTTDYLFINIEYLPRAASIAWAQGVVDSNTDVDYIFVSTHYLLTASGVRASDTEITDLWDDFLSQNAKIVLVTGGHVGGTPTAPVAERRTDNGVHQHLFNAQTLSGNNYNDSAYLRFYEIDQTDGHSVSVTTYNPIIDASLTDTDNQFNFQL